MTYGVPGHADEFGAELVEKWNDNVRAAFEDLRPSFGSRFSLSILGPSQARVRHPSSGSGIRRSPASAWGRRPRGSHPIGA
jgi:hypothetical protein